MVRFLDSSVVLRYLTRDDEERARIARTIIEHEDLLLSTFVLGEIAYTLRTAFGYPRRQVLDTVIDFVRLENIAIADAAKEHVIVALEKSQSRSSGLSLGDALILAQMQAAGCTEIYSFDKEFRDESIVVLDKPAGRS